MIIYWPSEWLLASQGLCFMKLGDEILLDCQPWLIAQHSHHESFTDSWVYNSDVSAGRWQNFERYDCVCWTGKDQRGSSHGLYDVLSRKFPGMAERKCDDSQVRVGSVSSNVWTGYLAGEGNVLLLVHPAWFVVTISTVFSMLPHKFHASCYI